MALTKRFTIQILESLSYLYKHEIVHCDLKPENILVAPAGVVTLIDFGGVSPIGSSIKQFTEVYDRGFWNAGSRKADPGYDLFSLAVINKICFIAISSDSRSDYASSK